MGLEQNNVNLLQVMDEGKILLVNLGSSDYLDREAARVFASLFLNEFFETAMRRATRAKAGERPRPFTLYLDEFQEYITDDVAAMLDQVRKGGLHMVLAHQHLGHFEDNTRLKESVFTNARIRAVFGGLSTPSASEVGRGDVPAGSQYPTNQEGVLPHHPPLRGTDPDHPGTQHEPGKQPDGHFVNRHERPCRCMV